MYADLVATRENFRFRIDEPTKGKWSRVCTVRAMKQQQMMEALVGWFLNSEENQESVLKFDRQRRENATNPDWCLTGSSCYRLIFAIMCGSTLNRSRHAGQCRRT